MAIKVMSLAVAMVIMMLGTSAQILFPDPNPEPILYRKAEAQAESVLDRLIKPQPSFCCSGSRCRGQCMPGYCKYPSAPIGGSCACPKPMVCCTNRIIVTPCSKCNIKARCVPSFVKCKTYDALKCPCPKGQKCCRGPFCIECGGRCMPREKCRTPFYHINSERCPCPFGQICCKRATCWGCTKNSACVSKEIKCLKPIPFGINGYKCTCPPHQQCCLLNCVNCGGTCVYKQCPKWMKQLAGPGCNCPNPYVCCKGNCTSPNSCVPKEYCIEVLGGWPVPGLCKDGRVCCQRPTCGSKSGNCSNAQCLKKNSMKCLNVLNNQNCTCPPGKFCCRYTCTLPGCNGTCIKGGCDPKTMKSKPLSCTCPADSKCCIMKCPYQCITQKSCDAAGGQVILFAPLGCGKGLVCCKGSCVCPTGCVSPDVCKKSGGDPVPSSNCKGDLVCCQKRCPKPYACVPHSQSKERCQAVVHPSIGTCNLPKTECCVLKKLIVIGNIQQQKKAATGKA